MISCFRQGAIAISLMAGMCGGPPAAAEVLYDSRGRPVVVEPDYRRDRGPRFREREFEPRREIYREPDYNPYPEQRRSRFEQARICVTGLGQTCPLVGPTFVGKQCRCVIPGYGRLDGTAR